MACAFAGDSVLQTKPAITRRGLLVGGALMLSGCGKPAQTNDLSASAARNNDRVYFRQSVGWLSRAESGLRTVAIAFTPFDLDDQMRRDIAGNNGVFPVVTQKVPMLDLRLELEKPDSGNKIALSDLRAIQMTFWNFAEPTPVIRIDKTDWSSTSDIEVLGLDGDYKRRGYVVGTIRGKSLYRTDGEREDVYLWNLEITTSLD
jgi:hypothetical protein